MRSIAPLCLFVLFGLAPVAAQDARPREPRPLADGPRQPADGSGAAATFSHPGIAKDAERYETFLKSSWKAGKGKPAELRVAGEKLLAIDPRAASRTFAEAVVADDRNAQGWLGLARALLAITPDPNRAAERYDLPLNASGAAYRAMERATDVATRARALSVLGEALQRRSSWRPAIDALRASLALADSADARARFDKLRAEHGFRMTDYKSETELASPRLCLQFSERIQGASGDIAKFVTLDGREPQALSVEDRQICVEGLAHGQRYEVRVRAGLPAEIGEVLEKAAEIAAYLPDRKPMARFTGRAYVLPARGQQGIPVTTVNTKAVAVEIYRVGDRNLASVVQSGDLARQLSSYDLESIRERTGQRVWQGTLDVTAKHNEEVTTALPISDAVPDMKPGAYVVTARAAGAGRGQGDDDAMASQWFVISDLGLTALSGTDAVHAFVRSLGDAKPVPGATVRLVARNNEVLGEARSDQAGYVRFDGGIARGEGGTQPAILVAERGGADYAFLDLTAAAFDLSDRGVKGRESPGALDAYLYAERGVYRPGEEVNITGLVRDRAGEAATLPVTLIVSRPDGVEWKRLALTDQGLGGRLATLDIGGDAMTGTWRARLHADPKAPAIASLAFLVEDFVPERLDMTLAPAVAALRPDTPAAIKTEGRFLYGPPAAGLALEGEVVVKASAKELPGLAGYRFGLAEEKPAAVRAAIEGLPQTGADGKAEVTVVLPAFPHTARPLEADVILKLRETGGRTIERTVTLPVETGAPRIGVKPLFGADGAPEGEPAGFEVVMLDAEGKRTAAKGLAWTLTRLETSWQWYSRDGHWAYEPVTFKRKAATGTVDVAPDAAARIETRPGWGRYRLEVAGTGADAPVTSILFSAGWYGGDDTPDSPEMLDVALDKPAYKPGETAKLRIASKTGGTALVAVLGSGLHAVKEVAVAKGGAEVEIPVGADWGAGAYATAFLYRPMDEAQKRMPGRAIGTAWLALDAAARNLKVTLAAPERVKSGALLKVPVAVDGLGAGEEARLTVAAVDAGILNLTRFEPPAPERWFGAQRKLGVELRDYYGRLIDGMRAERGALRSGGDGGGGLTMQGAPTVEEIVSLFSGVVRVGADGKAEVEFQLPDFNGSVRLMAVAWSKGKAGHAAKDVIVRDPVSLTVSGPRFLTLGDEARLDLSLHNVEGPKASYQVVVEESSAKSRKTDLALALDPGQRKAERVALKPTDTGRLDYAVRVMGPDGIDVRRRIGFEVLPPSGDVKRSTVTALKEKGGRITLSKDLVADLIPGRTRITLGVGPAAALDVPGLLSALDRYPYGCAEQTVSRALPLLYANEVASTIGLGADKEIRARVQGAIDRVFEMQDASGAFGIWGPSSADIWLTGYVMDFLTRAKEQGYQIAPRPFAQGLDRLQNYLSYAQDFERGGEARAYALYVLARNARAPMGELRYYADTRVDRFGSALAKAQLGAALSLAGDKERAASVFRAALKHMDDTAKEAAIARADYGSGLRDGAALVTLAAETGLARMETPRLATVVAKAYQTRTHTSTQEQAWMLLAAKALGDQARETRLTVGGKAHAGALVRTLTTADLAQGFTVANDGEAPVDAVLTVIGASLTPEPAAAKGFKIERTAYTLDGKKLDLKSLAGGVSEIRQNDRLVVVLKIEAKEAGGRLLLVDRLPAGLEIENPRLVEGGDIKSLDWLKTSVKPEHTEFRDDRFVAAFNFFGPGVRQEAASIEGPDGDGDDEGDPAATADASRPKGPVSTASVAYVVRAVTPGSFVHPAATIEDMYRPERHARSASGRLVVKE